MKRARFDNIEDAGGKKAKKKYSETKTAFLSWFQTFKTLLNQLSEYKSKDEIVGNLFLKTDQQIHMHFTKPENIQLFGLDNINAQPGSRLSININLVMPRTVFNVKDYLNNRYFVKRYCYLQYIAKFISKKDICAISSWILNQDSILSPILQLTLKNPAKVKVQIYATPTENYFNPTRFLPNVNNVKKNLFENLDISEDAINDSPTTFYNASMARDVTFQSNNSYIEETLNNLSHVQEAIKLLTIWLKQRQLNVGLGTFNEELIIYIMIYLINKRMVNKHMSSYQVVRKFWNFINETDLIENPITLCENSDNLNIFKSEFDVVMLDRTGCYNVASFLNIELYRKVKTECNIALELFDEEQMNSIHLLFSVKVPMELQYDAILSLKSDSRFDNILDNVSDREKVKYLGHHRLLIIKEILKQFHYGLNKRALHIVPFVPNQSNWIGEYEENLNRIVIGINLNPTTAFNYLERGPPLNDPKEVEFKDFWGELASDRRFKDGSVCVAVFFQTDTKKARREIIKTIINLIVMDKLHLQYTLYYDNFEDLVVNKRLVASYPLGTNEEASLKISATSDELSKILRELKMALTITGVYGISDVFSFTEVFPPIAAKYKVRKNVAVPVENNMLLTEKHVGAAPRYMPPIECVLQLEHSSKWPRDLQGIRAMKTAFYLEISKHLSKNHNILSLVRPETVDVFYQGFVFRYSLYLPREIGLLKKESISNGVTVYKDSPESKAMERKLNVIPKIVGGLKVIQSEYRSFGPSTALIKRWLRSHLIDDFHFPDVVVNLLNASLFLNKSMFPTPSTPQVQFLRFLKFISELPCDVQAVIVNFNDEITKETMAEIESKLLQNREAWPPLYIAIPYDNCESTFTKRAPSKEVIQRVKVLAAETLQHIVGISQEEKLIPVKSLFTPNFEGYNAVIHLRALGNPRRYEQILEDDVEQIRLPAFTAAANTKMPVTGFDPVQLFLRDLRENYGEFALFFHDTYGGNAIGVLWTLKTLEQKDFKVSHVDGRKLVNNQLVLNEDALIEDFYIIGKHLVKSINKV